MKARKALKAMKAYVKAMKAYLKAIKATTTRSDHSLSNI